MKLDRYDVDALPDGTEVVQFVFQDGTVLEADAQGISRGDRLIPWDALLDAFDEDAVTLKA
ncbi:MAG TPA: hypothetical protein VF202_02195 [Trueperaceae bacterium]|jgi:hypothetical protein